MEGAGPSLGAAPADRHSDAPGHHPDQRPRSKPERDPTAATFGSIFLGLISQLPETPPVTVPAASVVQVVGANGGVVAGPASPLPDGTPIPSNYN